MSKTRKIFIRALAAAFFLAGVAVLPFGVWASSEQDELSNPVLDWTWSIANVVIPWLISFALVRHSMRKKGL
jgi:hypothetical protein